ncbi:hypothetical protein SG18_13590 [Pandoraea apista]|nr:hypothetical protein SG18_13590 [Pandoraea apista]AKH73057.1 hypothetical protein XM39_13785 [Pandoraea apista]AKI61442.1 hypothetical protein AA956_06045 [Pandoraea apista]
MPPINHDLGPPDHIPGENWGDKQLTKLQQRFDFLSRRTRDRDERISIQSKFPFSFAFPHSALGQSLVSNINAQRIEVLIAVVQRSQTISYARTLRGLSNNDRKNTARHNSIPRQQT